MDDLQKEILVYSDGAQYAIDIAFAGLVSKKGFIDSRNMRLASMGTSDLAATKIKGEVLLYPLVDNKVTGGSGNPLATTYKCIAACFAGDYLFEVWVDKLKLLPVVFRLNGLIVAMSTAIPFTIDNPIQLDVSDETVDTIVVLTDFKAPPQVYSILSLYNQSGYSFVTGLPDGAFTASAQYFSAYNAAAYGINLFRPVDIVVIKDVTLTQPGGSQKLGEGGLIAGEYAYEWRPGDSDGNFAGWSHPTPLVPVPASLNTAVTKYGQSQIQGGAVAQQTQAGVWLMFRKTNHLYGFTTFQIRRLRYNTGSPRNSVATDEIIFQGTMTPGEISIESFWDCGAAGTIYDQTADPSGAQAIVKRFKSPRFHDSRLYGMNVEYEDNDASGITVLSSPDKMWPCMFNMGVYGHKDVIHQTYFKAFMNEEKYGFGIECYAGAFARSFVVPVTGSSSQRPSAGTFDNYQMPNRREQVAGDHLNSAQVIDNTVQTVLAADVDFNAPVPTFEVFGWNAMVTKDAIGRYKNIANITWDETQFIIGGQGLEQDGVVESGSNLILPYLPWRPVKHNDSEAVGLPDQQPVLSVFEKDISGGSHAYNPAGFLPKHHALGMKMAGVSSVPSFVQSFSIVPTQPAGKNFAQGIGFYSLNRGNDYGGTDHATKFKNQLLCYFPDIESGLVNIDELLNNPENFEIHVAAPFGVFGELYNNKINHDDTPHGWKACDLDMILYARVLFENGNINPTDNTSIVGNTGYVTHKKWRNSTQRTWTPNGTESFNIILIQQDQTYNGEQQLLRITLDKDIYATSAYTEHFDVTNTEEKNFLEPIYVINIIRKVADVDITLNQQQYALSAHYQKIAPVVGRSDGTSDQFYYLVDERWEDSLCYTGDTTDRYVWVQDTLGNMKQWVNVSQKSGGALSAILTSINTNTGAYAGFGGVYTQFVVLSGISHARNNYAIHFTTALNPGGFPAALFTPSLGSLIIMKYDNRFPLTIYGGDTYIGEATCAMMDGVSADGGEPYGTAHDTQFRLQVALPYLLWAMNPRVVMYDPQAATNKIQQQENIQLSWIRQLVLMFTCSTRTNVPMTFDTYPTVQYVTRPLSWDTTKNIVDNGVFVQYVADYPVEVGDGGFPLRWREGGFYYKQDLDHQNIDYSQLFSNIIFYSKPKSGFVARTVFPNRVIWTPKKIAGAILPSYRTFPVLNAMDIDPDTGEIKFAWSALSSKGNNLYAFTERGVCLLLIDKFLARQLQGDFLSVVAGQDEQVWISKDTGMNDEIWRTFAEYDNTGWWGNRNSIYRIENDNIDDILRDGLFHGRVYGSMLQQILPGFLTDATAAYDVYHDEYYINIRKRPQIIYNASTVTVQITGPVNTQDTIFEVYGDANPKFPLLATGINKFYIANKQSTSINLIDSDSGAVLSVTAPAKYRYITRIGTTETWTIGLESDINNALYGNLTFVYADRKNKIHAAGKWLGRNDLTPDKFAVQDNRTVLLRFGSYNLDSGYELNGSAIIAEMAQAMTGSNGSAGTSKEFVWIRINTNNKKPKRVEFYETIDQLNAGTPVCFLDITTDATGLYLKDYGRGYMARIPRKAIEPFDRLQGRQMIYKVIYDTEDEFVLSSTEIEFQELK